jgi:hypothetical protein
VTTLEDLSTVEKMALLLVGSYDHVELTFVSCAGATLIFRGLEKRGLLERHELGVPVECYALTPEGAALALEVLDR